MKPHRGSLPLTEEQVILKLTEHCYLRDDCLVWAGRCCSNGIPSLMWQRRTWNARRLLLQLRGRPVPRAHVVWATCGEHRCMNEAHWRVGTRTSLGRWMSEQGRLSCGAAHSLRLAAVVAHRSRVSLTRVAEVQSKLAGGMSHEEVGRALGVTGQRIRDVIARATEIGLTMTAHRADQMREAA